MDTLGSETSSVAASFVFLFRLLLPFSLTMLCTPLLSHLFLFAALGSGSVLIVLTWRISKSLLIVSSVFDFPPSAPRDLSLFVKYRRIDTAHRLAL